jgi:4-amino-4-deoxy-L-arabinose transferase-like glycosyltransferase
MAEKRIHDAFWLGVLLLLLVATGLGLRDPWPADEPRFTLVARDVVSSGDWLFPRVGGDLYHDKPPLYFWLLALGYLLTGSIRASFLIPSFLAAIGITVLVYDLARRLAGREAALLTAALLICTVQFLLVTRGAQIDATLCLLTTLSLYGLLRHLMLGPAWGWYFIGGLAAGLGVITKGVGFLPLLILLPYAFLRSRGFAPLPRFSGGARWSLAAFGFLAGIAVWLVPMLVTVARTADPQLIAYRDGILLQQTVQRYASAWHHVRPWYYFLVEVIPPLWFPASLLLFWLVPRWKTALLGRDARVWLPLAWGVIVLLFFSLSPGKRGIYIFPALPALMWAAAPYLPALLSSRRVLAWPIALICLALVWSYVITPRIDAERSGRGFVEHALAQVPAGRELAFAAAKEQFFLYIDRPVVNFGHARWREQRSEANDAARWLNAAPGRMLLVPGSMLKPCFEHSPKRVVGETSRETWSLVELPADPTCAERGDPRHAIRYSPTPSTRSSTER